MTVNVLFRLIDFVASIIGLIIGLPIMVLIFILGYFDTGAPIFIQERVGKHKKPFKLIKFRTMKPGTASVATHLASASAITPFGGFLRKTKLDELPQLINVLKGDMSLVGPRPCLYSQGELIEARERNNVFDARPGITGLAQVNGIDMSNPEYLAQVDQQMLGALSLRAYVKYLALTLIGGGSGDRVKTH